MAYGRGAAAVRAIDEVSLEITHGEFIAVVGPSGCGKSSLMKLISGLHPPASGTLTFEGRPVTFNDPRVATSLGRTPPPSDAELRMIREELDPAGVYTR